MITLTRPNQWINRTREIIVLQNSVQVASLACRDSVSLPVMNGDSIRLVMDESSSKEYIVGKSIASDSNYECGCMMGSIRDFTREKPSNTLLYINPMTRSETQGMRTIL